MIGVKSFFLKKLETASPRAGGGPGRFPHRWRFVPVALRAGGASCRWRFVPVALRAGGTSCRWRFVPVALRAGGASCRWRFVPVALRAGGARRQSGTDGGAFKTEQKNTPVAAGKIPQK